MLSKRLARARIYKLDGNKTERQIQNVMAVRQEGCWLEGAGRTVADGIFEGDGRAKRIWNKARNVVGV